MFLPAIVICLLRDRRRKRKRDREFRQILEDAKAGRIPEGLLEEPKNGVIGIEDDGFTVTVPGRRTTHREAMKWGDVREVRAFKEDLYTVDRICWRFCKDDDERAVDVNEEMLGFAELRKSIESRFGVRDEDWFQDVAFPAFVENMTVIWPGQEQKQKPVPGG